MVGLCFGIIISPCQGVVPTYSDDAELACERRVREEWVACVLSLFPLDPEHYLWYKKNKQSDTLYFDIF